MSAPFSETYATFEEWLAAHPTGSLYRQRIVRGHARYPVATLSQLRRHPQSGQPRLSETRTTLPHHVPSALLSPRERMSRGRALEVLSEVRRGKGSLSGLSRAYGISPNTVRRATGAFRKKRGHWIPRPTDRIERWLKTYERGTRREVLVADSRTAALLSRYAHAVGIYLETGDPRPLAKFKGRTYRDAKGKVHRFETRAAAIRAATERSEADFEAFADLYAEPGEGDELG